MDYLAEMGSLALGSRLKRLSERLAQGVATIYSSQQVAFEPRWFPVFRLLGLRGEVAITDIAAAINVTHPAVNQVASELLAENLIVQVADADDKRRRLLSLSKKGKQLYAELEPVWRAILVSIDEAMEESQRDLLKAIGALEAALDRSDLPARFVKNERLLETAKVQVRTLESAADAKSFRKLNEAWITKYFAIEPEDVAVLSSAQKIIDKGGSVFFACLSDKVIGTCALMKTSKHSFEVAKMAVNEAYQGLGAGRLLLEACVKQARKEGAREVTLETNTKLASAVQLYKSAGFKVENSAHRASKYSRVDLVMKLDLASKAAAKR